MWQERCRVAPFWKPSIADHDDPFSLSREIDGETAINAVIRVATVLDVYSGDPVELFYQSPFASDREAEAVT